ncbi:hypothetical protein FRB96_001888 [Tulasnella sp. 330]|nr:hypothetical protein FRB96_001888 [Tulasnella sp. 330]
MLGLSMDFVTLNAIAFACYSTYNANFFWNDSVREEYRKRHDGNDNSVMPNDVAFAFHAFLLASITLGQTYWYPRAERQRVSTFHRVVIAIFFALATLDAMLVLVGAESVIDFLYHLSYFKLYVTTAKYIPQAVINYKRKSTVGFSIEGMILDLSGGSLSLIQSLIIAHLDRDWSSVIGNPIRDLEARVELLSGNKDETYGQLRAMLRALMTENQQLRGLIRDLSAWIGNGTGGPLATHLSGIGWQMAQFEAFLNHTETDTAFDVFSTLKKTNKGKNGTMSTSTAADANASASPMTNDSGEQSNRKRRRAEQDYSGENISAMMEEAAGMQSPLLSSVAPPEAGSSSNSFATFLGGRTFRSPPPGSGNIPGSSVPSGTNPQGPQKHQQQQQQCPSGPTHSLLGLAAVAESHLPMNLPMPPDPVGASYPGFSLPTNGYNSSTPVQASSGPSQYAGPLFGDEIGGVDDGGLLRKNEAGRLFKYHLDNFRRNPSYCLPKLLNPTLVQRTIPHEQIIDSVPFADLRDRMILLKDRFSLPDVLHQMFLNATLHGDDILQQSNWELHKPWMERYPFLVAETTLAIANRWRTQRGEPEITMAELNKES